MKEVLIWDAFMLLVIEGYLEILVCIHLNSMTTIDSPTLGDYMSELMTRILSIAAYVVMPILFLIFIFKEKLETVESLVED